MRFFTILSVLAVALVLAVPADAASGRPGKLKNGFQYIIQKNESSPLVVMQLWVGHGSVDETDGEAGLAHFLEHLAFRSKDIAKRVEELGGDINAYTTYDRTVYYLTLPSSEWEEGFKVLRDILISTTLDEESFNKERLVVLEEMKRSYDNPQRMAYKLFFSTALDKHPMRRPVLGYDETIQNVTMKSVQEFYRKFYAPEGSFLTVVGNVQESQVEGAMKKYFGADTTRKPAQFQRSEEPDRTEPRAATAAMKINSCYAMIGFRTPGIKHADVPAIDVLSYLLGESSTSILNQTLKEQKQLVNSVHSYQMTLSDMGFLAVSANMDCGNLGTFIDQAVRILMTDNLPVTDADLRKVLKSYESNYFFSKERFNDIAADLSSSFFYYNNPEYSKVYIDQIRAVTLKDVLAARRKYLKPETMTAIVLGPQSFTDMDSTVKSRIAKLSETRQPFQSYTLKNGIQLYLNRKEGNPTFGLHITTIAGSRVEDEKTKGLSGFALSALLRGTKERSYRKILDELELMGGSLSGYSTKNLSGIKGKFLSSSFEDAVRLTGDILAHFNPPADEIDKLKKLTLADIAKKKENPNRLLKDLYFATAYGSSPLGFPAEGTADTVNDFNRKKVEDHFFGIFSPDRLIVTVSGDLPFNAVDVLAASFEQLPVIVQEPRERHLGVHPSSRFADEKHEFKQSHIMAGFPVPGLKSALRPHLQLLATILSNQSGRLFSNLRDKQGLAYALGAFLYEAPEESLFNLYMGTSPENTDKAKDGLIEELRKAVNEGVTDDELAKAKNQMITDMAQGLQENLDIATIQAQNALLFDDPHYYREYEKAIRDVKKEELTAKLKEFFKPENAIVAIIDGAKPEQPKKEEPAPAGNEGAKPAEPKKQEPTPAAPASDEAAKAEESKKQQPAAAVPAADEAPKPGQ